VLADGAAHHWRLGESSGDGYDSAGSSNLAVGPGVNRGTAGAVVGDADTAATFSGTGEGLATTQRPVPGPDVFTVEAWFRTTSTAGGKVVGFGDQPTGTSGNYDRHVYLDESGRVTFGVWTGAMSTVSSEPGLGDGRWHHVVASLGPGGLALYIDGRLAQARDDVTAGQPYSGYWRIGGDSPWAGATWFAGDVDDVAVYPSVLTPEQVTAHHRLATTTPPPPNRVPAAAVDATATGLAVAVDGSASTDEDGTVTSWAWDFGDGATGSGATAEHTYATAGTYTVRLTVTDDDGATATAVQEVTVAPPPNQAPTAAATATTSGLTVAVDASTSTDADGTVAAWTWEFGDGATGSGATASHTFAAAGTYTVRLTVTDDDGATATAVREVTVAAPPSPAMLASDAFGRTVTGGWGTADAGGAWTASAGASRLSVTPGAAELALPSPGNNTGAFLSGVAATGTDVQTSFTLSSTPTGPGTYVYVTGRRVGAGLEYRVRVRVMADGRVAMVLSRLAGGAEAFVGSEVVVPGLVWTPGTALAVRVVTTGTAPTQVAATVWSAGQPQPAAPQLVRTDTSAALQAAGSVGLAAYRSTSATAATTVRFGSLTVRPPA
jgi:PKD repeat protein